MQVIDHGDGVVGVLFTSKADGNFISSEQIRAFASTLDGVIGRTDLSAVVLSGEGENFCSGRVGAKGLTAAVDIRNDLALILEVNSRLRNSPVPFIAAVEGKAFGFGCGFSTQCDITIAASDARFALPEMSHKLAPLVVMSYFGKFVPLKKGFELALTSREFGATEAATIGVATEVVAPGMALTRALEFARLIAGLDGESVRLLRRFVRQMAGLLDDADARNGIDAMAVAIAARVAAG
jgi:enoyl-CoA hydratase/carnithine racemase